MAYDPETGWISSRFGTKRYLWPRDGVFVAASGTVRRVTSLNEMVVSGDPRAMPVRRMISSRRRILMETFPTGRAAAQIAMAMWGRTDGSRHQGADDGRLDYRQLEMGWQ